MKRLIVGSLLVGASSLVSEAAIAKCANISIGERFSEAENVVLVSIIDAHDGPVPWPYGLRKGATLPGRLLMTPWCKVMAPYVNAEGKS